MRILPPFTGDQELDAWNQEVFNYLNGLPPQPIYNQGTGIITDPNDDSVIGYIMRYMHVKYADDRIGTGFSDMYTNKAYYGLHNSSDISESPDYADYTWYEVTGGFGVSNKLFHKLMGGRSIEFYVGTVTPDDRWVETLLPAIDLDDLIGTGGVDTDELADRSVTTIKIALEAVTNDELADNAVRVENIDATGTPGPTTFLNGDMAWIEVRGEWFLEQTLLDDILLIASNHLGGHLYTDAAATDPIAVINDDTAAIGSTLTLVNLAAMDSFITYPTGTIFVLGANTEEITLEIAANGKATLIKVEANRWVAEGFNLTSSTFDPRYDYLITEISLDFIETEDGRLIRSEN